jgi:hypothetical protein
MGGEHLPAGGELRHCRETARATEMNVLTSAPRVIYLPLACIPNTCVNATESSTQLYIIQRASSKHARSAASPSHPARVIGALLADIDCRSILTLVIQRCRDPELHFCSQQVRRLLFTRSRGPVHPPSTS